jgi:Flp pilus assembly protein TadB
MINRPRSLLSNLCWRRSAARVSELQKMLAQANIDIRGGNFLGISAVADMVATIIVYGLSKRVEVAWIALLIGFILPYWFVVRRARKNRQNLK